MTRYLIYTIIKKLEKSSIDWKEDSAKNHTIWITQELYGKDNGRKAGILKEAAEYLQQGYLEKCDWVDLRSDLNFVNYSDTKKTIFYELIGRTPKYLRIEAYMEEIRHKLAHTTKVWIRNYYLQLLQELEKGDIPSEFEKKLSKSPVPSKEEVEQGFWRHHEYDKVFQCLDELDKLEEPVYKRIFSKKCFRDSKTFENEIQTKIIGLVKKYGSSDPELCIYGEMEDYEVLREILLEEYGASLSLKGSLKIRFGEDEIDLGKLRYGCELNSDSLRYAKIPKGQKIRKVITIENKANYMSMPMEDGTLILFSHGFPAPLERQFLKNLHQALEGQPVEYYHSGDLDYGGICIFRHIRTRIFPELRPYQMDLETYEKYYQSMGTPLGKVSLERLKTLEEPQLQELIARMAETGIGIEQESFLVAQVQP